MRIDFTDTSLDKLRRRDPIFGPVPIVDSYGAASVIVRRHGEVQGLCRRIRAEKIWRSRSSPHDLHRLRLFREGIGYHLIVKHHQSFPQIYARNPVLKPRVKLLPRLLKPMFAHSEYGTRFAPNARIYRVTPIAQWNDWKGKQRVSKRVRAKMPGPLHASNWKRGS
jgi:hypothetical protein